MITSKTIQSLPDLRKALKSITVDFSPFLTLLRKEEKNKTEEIDHLKI